MSKNDKKKWGFRLLNNPLKMPKNPFGGMFARRADDLIVRQPTIAVPQLAPNNLKEAIEQKNIGAAINFAQSLSTEERYNLLYNHDENVISLLLHSAVSLKSPDLIIRLLSGLNNEQVYNVMTIQNTSGQTPLILASGLIELDLAKSMLDALSRVDNAIADPEKSQTLMKDRRMAVMMTPNGIGDTFFHRIAANFMVPVDEKVSIVEFLDLSTDNKIMILSTQSSVAIAKPGDAKSPKPSKSTPLHFAMSIASSTPFIAEITKGLKRYDLEPIIDIQNGNGDTCLHNAARNGHIENLGLVLDKIKLESKLLKAARPSVTSFNSLHDSALSAAVSSGRYDAVEIFLSSLGKEEMSVVLEKMKEENPVTRENFTTKFPDLMQKIEAKLSEFGPDSPSSTVSTKNQLPKQVSGQGQSSSIGE